jgi:pimeloyl-ACP methyl ester carboxylesterase
MLPGRTGFLLLIFSLTLSFVYCTGQNEKEETISSKSNTMDTLSSTPGTQTTIRGTAGYIYVDDGGTKGIPVLFVHSFGGNTGHWANQLQHLRDPGRRAIAMDLRGHGRSDSSGKQDYSVESLAMDIAAVADSLKLQEFVLVGHSMGGSAAIAYAGTHPDRVAGLMLVGTPGKTPQEQSKPVIASLARPEVEKIERDGMHKLSRETSLSIIKAEFKFDPLPFLKKYPGPKLIVSADGERQPNALHSLLPHIPHQTIPGTSHWVQMDKPGEFNDIMDEFLKTVK